MAVSTQLYQGFRQLYMMEVCGGHTHTIMKFGLKQLLPDNLHFVHGPGCPVCIMPKERIDQAIELAQQPDVKKFTGSVSCSRWFSRAYL